MPAPQYEQAGADIAGTGTANTIPRWTGASTLGDSIITQTGTSRITIGSGSYAGTSLNGVRLVNGVDSYFTASDGTRTSILGADGAAFVGTLTNHDFQFRANNSIAATIQASTGYVGIGTASPGQKLDVAGGLWVNGAASVGASASRGLFSVEGSTFRQYTGDGTGWTYAISKRSSSVTTDLFTINDATNYAYFYSNVGIGTTSPTDSGGWSAGRILDVRSGSAGSSAVAYFGDSARATNTQIGFYGTGYGFVGTVTNYDFRVLTNNATRGIWSSSSLDISATSGYGLKLPATNGTTYNTDPNTLDCYAEKDLTATMTCGTSGTITLSASTLKFTRVGRVVHVSGRLVINSVSSPLGRLQVDIGLGANERPSVYTSSTVWLNAWAAGFTQTPFGFIAPGGTILYVDRWGAGSMNIDAAQYAQANAEMMISLTYIV